MSSLLRVLRGSDPSIERWRVIAVRLLVAADLFFIGLLIRSIWVLYAS